MFYIITHDIKYIESITGLTKEERDNIRKYHYKLIELEQIEVEKISINIYHSKHDNLLIDKTKKTEANYAAWLLAVKKLMDNDKAMSRKSELTDDEKRLAMERRIAKMRENKQKKNAPLRAAIEKHYDEIRLLKEEQGLSYSELAEYLATTYRSQFKKITAVYVRLVYLDIKSRLEKQT